MTNERPEDGIRSVGRTFDIIETIQTLGGARLSEIADELDIAKSTAHRHVATLLHREYLTREGDEFQLSLKFLDLGEYSRACHDEYHLVEPKVDELAAQTEERVQFLVEEHGYGVYVFRSRGSRAVRTDPGIGKRVPLHTTAAGKAILANYPEERVREIVELRGLDAVTDHTITQTDALYEELESIRERGYAVNNEENVDRLRAVGVPIRKQPGNRVLGALSVSGPTHRMKSEWFNEELPELLLGVANEIELNIAHA
ncbi:IclR family transcriptional regulator [Haloferax sp. YSMS24]|uniref:IclR family transcriptional regulator n=1 Tax=unclassified Haloferax TaxID=2625095 RepID=UPI00398CDC9D